MTLGEVPETLSLTNAEAHTSFAAFFGGFGAPFAFSGFFSVPGFFAGSGFGGMVCSVSWFYSFCAVVDAPLQIICQAGIAKSMTATSKR